MGCIEGIISLIAHYLSIFAIFWAVPGALMNMVVALGSVDKIIFIDEQLAKDINKLYWANGLVRNSMYTRIANRLYYYWLVYPFVFRRGKTKSIKFKLFMWFNSIGIWSLFIALFIIFIEKNASSV